MFALNCPFAVDGLSRDTIDGTQNPYEAPQQQFAFAGANSGLFEQAGRLAQVRGLLAAQRLLNAWSESL